MRIGIDITPVTRERSGVGNYCVNLLAGLYEVGRENVFTGFVSGLRRVDGEALPPRFFYRRLPVPTRLLYQAWRHFEAPRVDRFLGEIDVYHATNYVTPPTRRAPCVVMFHDLAVLKHPEWCSPRIARTFGRGLKGYAERAQIILTPSWATKDDTVELLGVDPGKIRAVHHAADETFRRIPRPQAAMILKGQHDIEGPFFLFVGTLEPRKNLVVLLEAFAKMRGDLPHRLVLVGGVGWNAEEILDSIDRLDLEDRVVLQGFVANRYLPLYYSSATALVFPSRYEGFGLPVLEAMRCECPVITADNSSLPEVAGDAALMVDASDVDGLAEAMRRVAHDEKLCEDLVARGCEQVKRFSWRKCAQETLAVYREVLPC